MTSMTITTAKAKGYIATEWTAGELTAFVPEGPDTTVVLWISFGHVHGVERFGRHTLKRRAEGGLTMVLPNGNSVVQYPADRILRILSKR